MLTWDGESVPEPAPSSLPAVVETSVPQDVDGFVISFRVAIDARDVGFLLERLHPVVIASYGTHACRAFIESEVLEIENYEQAGPALGPIIRSFESPAGSQTAQTYEVPVQFDFRGEHYQDRALFGLSGEDMHWFAECA